MMEKKRYVLFGYHTYYPSGGMNDALMSFDTEEELLNASNHYECDYYTVFDTEEFVTGDGSSPISAFKDI